MAVGHRLPNGYIVLLVTPREGVLLRDQLLEPEQFPWMNTESQMIGMEVRNILTQAVASDALDRLGEATQELAKAMVIEEAKQKGYWQCPHCSYVNGREQEGTCANCEASKEEEPDEV